MRAGNKEMEMDLQDLIVVAKKYEDALQEHKIVDHNAQAHTDVDICSHLHAEVSELFNVIRRKKAEHEGMSYEDGIIDELQDILCIWSLAVNLLAPNADVDKMIQNSADMFKIVAKKKKGVDIESSTSPKQVTVKHIDDIAWEPSATGQAGLSKKMLYRDDRNGVVTFFKFEDVVAYPTFVLSGYASYYVIEGSMRMAGKEHFAGTFIHCDERSLTRFQQRYRA